MGQVNSLHYVQSPPLPVHRSTELVEINHQQDQHGRQDRLVTINHVDRMIYAAKLCAQIGDAKETAFWIESAQQMAETIGDRDGGSDAEARITEQIQLGDTQAYLRQRMDKSLKSAAKKARHMHYWLATARRDAEQLNLNIDHDAAAVQSLPADFDLTKETVTRCLRLADEAAHEGNQEEMDYWIQHARIEINADSESIEPQVAQIRANLGDVAGFLQQRIEWSLKMADQYTQQGNDEMLGYYLRWAQADACQVGIKLEVE